MPDLTSLLQRTFGFPTFRTNQEAVCRAATDGRDVLLVMPTGAGKSLCYQLPAVARGGTALVVSPLIALMDDQAAKLSAHGLNVARIHSGLSRDDSRQACRDYLDGALNFLFIAPERLRVPGFPEMLSRRKPSLIAIDEAHCISAWGHDFRPDYRTLGEHLPALRPAPVIALTATATPTVQQDIVAQLQLQNPALFIHGFRRSNLAIEVMEMSKPRRHVFTAELLATPSARPAIVYAPSRKASEELAAELNHHFPAAAYHAGLESSVREHVQRDFQSGKLEVVVATIAFGMGIDKADVRTVVHTALPASVEAFYQEIGRAGRDGLPSRTVLLHSYADRKMHEFFLERDYPPATDLARVAQTLTGEYLMPEPLAQRLKMDLETFSKAVEKLIAQGAATVDLAGNVRRAGAISSKESWRAGYEAQIAFRRSQLDRMSAFAETQQCRMTAVIRHFGDTADAHRPCGQCDFCSPSTTSAQTFVEPTSAQTRDLRTILSALAHAPSRATGKLYTDLSPSLDAVADRKQFDVLLDALARAGLITLTAETFLNSEGKVLPYKKAALTHEGRSDDASELTGVVLPTASDSEATPSRSRKRKAPGSRASGTNPRALGTNPRALRRSTEDVPTDLTAEQKNLDANLRAWRKSEAAKTGKPAFIVLSDAVIRSLAIAQPHSLSELLTVSGIGPNKADQFGATIIAICRGKQLIQALPLEPSLQETSTRIEDAVERAKEDVQAIKQRFRLSAEDLRPLNLESKSGRTRARFYDESAQRRLAYEEDLRIFAQEQAMDLNRPSSELLSEAAIAEILQFRPKTLEDFKHFQNLRGDLPESFYESLLMTCLAEYKPEREPTKNPHKRLNAVDVVGVREPSHIFHRTRPTPSDPTAALTPDQQLLDAQLRAWRKAESERIGLPQFFVLGSSTLRSIVLLRPRTIAQLQTITGVGPDKAQKFGATILNICGA
jgi:ATP-dependent DNA helicase RecQ